MGQFLYYSIFGSNQNYPKKVHVNKSYSKMCAHFGWDISFLISFLPSMSPLLKANKQKQVFHLKNISSKAFKMVTSS